MDEVYPQILPHPNSNLRTFSFTELKTATRNFRSDTVLGEGGFGTVYKGWLDNRPSARTASGTVIAVKKLNPESLQGLEEWQVISFTSIVFSTTYGTSLICAFSVRSIFSEHFHIPTWSNSWDTAWKIKNCCLSMSLCKRAAWRTIFLEVSKRFSTLGICLLSLISA